MSETFKVSWVELNQFGFGNVKLVGGETLHEKGRYGFGTGKKEMPPCEKGDTITAEVGSNAKGYPSIKNIKVVPGGTQMSMSQAGLSKPSFGGSQFRSVPELNRIDALKFAFEHCTESEDPLIIIASAEIFFDYITDGDSTKALGDGLAPFDDDDILF